MTGAEIAALLEAALMVAGKVIAAALEGAATTQQALDRLDAIDAHLDGSLADLRARLAANDAQIDQGHGI
jgi:hypothetical protein